MKKQMRFLPLALILVLLIGVLPIVAAAAQSAPASALEANILDGKSFAPADRATATHSGTYSGAAVNYDYTKLTDSDMHLHTGRFSTKSSDSSQVFDGIVNLGGGYILGELQIYDFNPSSTASPFMGTALEIQVYSEGAWVTVVSCATNDEIVTYREGNNYLAFDLSGVKAEQIRIYIPSRLGTNSISIYEIKCSGILDSVADVFEGKVFEAGDRATPFFVGTHSGVSVNYDYTKLTDNNTHYQTGRFSTKASDATQVFDAVIDLGGGFFLGELKINDFNSTATTAPFMGTALEIEVYSLGKWTTVVSCASNDEIVAHRLDSTYLSFDLGGVRAEKVRIYIPSRLGTNSISINEIECSAALDHIEYNYSENLLLGKTFVPTESAAKEVHVDPTYDYGYPVITDGSYAAKGGRFSTRTSSATQQVDATVRLDGVYQLDELRIYDFNAHTEPNASEPGFLGTSLTIEVYADGAWHTALYCTRDEYGAHRVSPSTAWGAQYLSFDLSGVNAEMLRIYIPSNVEKNSISFYEITCSGNKIGEHTTHTEAEAVTENNVLPTCSSSGSYDNVVYCTVCGIEMSRETVSVNALGHKEKADVTAPTCTDKGYTTYTCTVCGESRVGDEVKALGHREKADVTAPTCTEKGYTTYACTVCGETRKGDDVAALGHKEKADVTTPTCTDKGYTTYTCTVCGETRKGDEVAALGHKEKADVTAPTCTEKGYTTYTCTVCGETRKGDEVAALGHSEKADVTAPTCTDKGYTTYTCTVCGESRVGDEVKALGHSEKADVTDPTCTEAGYTTYTCTVCGNSRTDNEVDALGHSEQIIPGMEATCTETGLTDGKLCTACGKIIELQTIIPLLGHRYVAEVTAPTCTEAGYSTYTCSACKHSYVTNRVAPLGHSESAVVTAPDCLNGGYTTYTCTVCSVSRVANETAPLGHAKGDAVIENNIAPTCESAGSYDSVIYCTACDVEISRETVIQEALGHTAQSAVTENEIHADCTNNGGYDTVVYCAVCGKELSREHSVIEALGHVEGDTVAENEITPDCDTDGSYHNVVYCTVCGEELSRRIVTVDALGHEWEDATTESPKTCKVCGKTEGDKLDPIPEPDVTPDTVPEKDHGECEAESEIERIITMILNFIRALLGIPERCVCGDEL